MNVYVYQGNTAVEIEYQTRKKVKDRIKTLLNFDSKHFLSPNLKTRKPTPEQHRFGRIIIDE